MLLPAYLAASAQPSDESLVSVNLLMERVVDVMEWELLEPAIDPELLPISSERAAQTWPEAADLLDEHAAHLDDLCAHFATDDMSMHQGHCRRAARVLRADIARAIETGNRERAARRLAGMLDAARQLTASRATAHRSDLWLKHPADRRRDDFRGWYG